MSSYRDETIAEALESIARRKYVLPAIQRDFKWKTDQICALFDSVMRNYPITSFLYWKVDAENTDEFRWYDFVLNYHELDRPGCEPHEGLPAEERIAVLDGQQRLTAFNIGLRGSHASRTKGRWVGRPQNYPTKHLFLDICAEPKLSDDRYEDQVYRFEFLTDEAADAATNEGEAHWFRVSGVMDFPSGPDGGRTIHQYLQERALGDHPHAYDAMFSLWNAVFQASHISYFTENEQNLDRVLDIFIRVNSLGEELSKSDLLMSLATAQWRDRDARKEVSDAVRAINDVGGGFDFTRDNVLKTGLVLSGISDVGFRAHTFNRANMRELESQWDEISRQTYRAVEVLSSFGLSSKSIGDRSVLIPIAFYLHHRQLRDQYLSSTAHAEDRLRVRDWVIRSLLMRGVFGSGLDTLLGRLRRTISDHGSDGFPSQQIEDAMAGLGKSLRFDEAVVDELTDSPYTDSDTFGLLSILYPHVDPSRPFDIDHIFPGDLLKRKNLREAGLSEDDIERAVAVKDRLGNLQLLPAGENIGKSNRLPLDWAKEQFPDQPGLDGYLQRNDMSDLPADLQGFLDFFEARRGRLRRRLVRVLGRPPGSLSDPD